MIFSFLRYAICYFPIKFVYKEQYCVCSYLATSNNLAVIICHINAIFFTVVLLLVPVSTIKLIFSLSVFVCSSVDIVPFFLYIKKLLWLFLSAFAKLRKATISFVRSVRLSVCPQGKVRLPQEGFSWNMMFENFSKIYRESSRFTKM